MKQMRKRILALFFAMAFTTSAIFGSNIVSTEAATSKGKTNAEQSTSADSENTEASPEEKQDVFEISDVKGFEEFLKNCQYDSWSIGKTVKLVADIDISSLEFSGVAYFSGTFEGNGHQISHVNLSAKGSDYGFFRYLGKSAVVNDLKLSGKVTADGSCENIGGFVGVNYGTLNKCSFEGTVDGKTAVGGIAGYNRSSGKIMDCKSDATVTATNQTGGIAGNNEGLISGCTSTSRVNTEELDTTLDLGGVDVGTLNITKHVVDRNDVGGIAGASSGIISSCTNKGTLGFAHTGYNVGGIAGRQSGKIIDCINEGDVYGRKDVGGIVGQAEPYIESEYLDEKVDAIQGSVKSISNTLNNIATTVSDTSSDAKTYMENISNEYKDSSESLSDSLNSLSDEIGESNPEAQQYMDNIEASLDRIDKIQGNHPILDKEQADEVQKEWQNINSNLSNIRGTVSDSNKTAEDFANDVSDHLKEKDSDGNIDKLTDTVDDGIQSVTDDIKKISDQLSKIEGTVDDTLSVVTGKEDYIEDISSAARAKDTDGVVSGSTNRGEVNGDLNVGGIAGTMNIEYDLDPEFDLDLTESTNIAVRSTVNNVVIHCINYGEVVSKKNCVGGIAGLQELGLVCDSESYGYVKSETGDYAGGIAGNSASAVSESYALCSIEGSDYVGGITGSGYTIKDCIAIPAIDADGEAIGSIAGIVSEEGTVQGNQFVNDTIDGIDNINYAGTADKVSYEDVMKLENIPDGFHKVIVTFKTDDELITTKTVAYNGSISKDQLPAIPEKDGYYAEWPSEITDRPITENKTVEAEYTRWTESIAGSERAENSKPIFLLEGKFYSDTGIYMEACGAEITDGNVVYAYNWGMDNVHDKEFETVKAHFYMTDSSGKNEIYYRAEGSSEWTLAETTEDGSYLVAEIPYAAAFALVHTDADYTIYYICGGAATVVLVLLLIRRRRKKRKAKRGKQ